MCVEVRPFGRTSSFVHSSFACTRASDVCVKEEARLFSCMGTGPATAGARQTEAARRQGRAATREYPPIDYWRVQEHE